MPIDPNTTPEEEAYDRLLDETKEILSLAAHTILEEAKTEAYKLILCHNYAYQLNEYDEAMDKMRLAAAKLTDQDCKLLAKLWRAALAAAASIDPDDRTPAGYRVGRGDYHRFYRMVSRMVEKTLRDKEFAELREKISNQEPEDYEISF